MGLTYWIGILIAMVAAIAGWRYLHRPSGDWKPLEQRLSDQVTQSAALEQECADSGGTAFGRLSTIR